MPAQQACSPAAVLWQPRGLRLPGPQRGWPLFCSPPSGLSGCGTAQCRLASAARCVSWAGGQEGAEDGPGHPGLTLRGGRASGLRNTTPRCTLASGSAGCGLHPRPAAAPQRGEMPSSSWDILVPVRGVVPGRQVSPSLEPARPLWSPRCPQSTLTASPVASAVSRVLRAPRPAKQVATPWQALW